MLNCPVCCGECTLSKTSAHATAQKSLPADGMKVQGVYGDWLAESAGASGFSESVWMCFVAGWEPWSQAALLKLGWPGDTVHLGIWSGPECALKSVKATHAYILSPGPVLGSSWIWL